MRLECPVIVPVRQEDPMALICHLRNMEHLRVAVTVNFRPDNRPSAFSYSLIFLFTSDDVPQTSPPNS